MSKLRLEKTIGDVPGTLSPDCVYAVRAGAGYDLRVSDMTGSVAHKLNLDTAQLLSIPEADRDFFDFVLVIQGGELRKMSRPNFIATVDPLFSNEETGPPENAIYADGEAIPDTSGEGYLMYGERT